MSTAALGQTVAAIEIGQTKSGTAPSGVDLYRFGGAAGTEITLTLHGPRSSGLILYTPDGQEMVTAQGEGDVRLDAILPLDDVYLVGVVRDQRAPYSLKLAGVEPDLNFARFASWVGYSHKFPNGITETQCWLDPGRQIRVSRSSGEVRVATIGRSGKTYYSASMDGRTAEWETLVAIEGNEEVRTVTYSDGSTQVRRWPLDRLEPKPNIGFVSYLC